MSYEYKNKNGETFGIVTAESGTMAYINGSYVAQAETEKSWKKFWIIFLTQIFPKRCAILAQERERPPIKTVYH